MHKYLKWLNVTNTTDDSWVCYSCRFSESVAICCTVLRKFINKVANPNNSVAREALPCNIFYLYAQRQVISVCGTHIQTNPQYQCLGKSHADLSVIIFSNIISVQKSEYCRFCLPPVLLLELNWLFWSVNGINSRLTIVAGSLEF